MQVPKDTHFQALQHTLGYVKGTTRQSILLIGSDQLQFHAYSDLDWASCPFITRSIFDYIILLGPPPSVGNPRSRALCHDPLLKLNIGLWITLPLNWHGLLGYLLNWASLLLSLFSSIVIINLLYLLLKTQFTWDKVSKGLLCLSYLPSNE